MKLLKGTECVNMLNTKNDKIARIIDIELLNILTFLVSFHLLPEAVYLLSIDTMVLKPGIGIDPGIDPNVCRILLHV